MHQYTFVISLLVFAPLIAFAEEVTIAPLAQYEMVDLTEQSIRSVSAGIAVNSPAISFVGLSTWHTFEQPLMQDYPNRYQTIDGLLEGSVGRHRYVALIKSESDRPVSGGIHTYQAGVLYGEEVIKSDTLSVVLGAGIAVGDFGIRTADGKNWPVIPVPLVRMNYHADQIDASFDFITSPSLQLTYRWTDHLRLTGDMRMDRMRDMRDLIFTGAVEYHPFTPQAEQGDFAALLLGFKNDSYGPFVLGGKEKTESIETSYYALFVAVDLTVVKMSAGYAFGGRELYDETEKRDIGEGIFFSLNALYPF